MTRRPSGAPGFTLLEVLVAIAILGVGMTAILSAQTGLFASSVYAEHISLATGMVRCKMSELELKLTKDGYPFVDVKDEGPCCADESVPGYRCKWKVEKVELPQPPTSTDLSSKLAGGVSGLGSLGAIAQVGQTNGASLGQNPGLGGISQLLAGQSPSGGFGMGPTGAPGASPAGAPTGDFGSTPFGSSSFGQGVSGSTPPGGPMGGGAMPGGAMGGASSLAPLVMSLVYPTLKPMLEASIRKLTITVEWQQGSKTKNLEAVQFVTNPMQGGIDPNAAQGADPLGGLGGLLGGQAGGALPGGATK